MLAIWKFDICLSVKEEEKLVVLQRGWLDNLHAFDQ